MTKTTSKLVTSLDYESNAFVNDFDKMYMFSNYFKAFNYEFVLKNYQKVRTSKGNNFSNYSLFENVRILLKKIRK